SHRHRRQVLALHALGRPGTRMWVAVIGERSARGGYCGIGLADGVGLAVRAPVVVGITGVVVSGRATGVHHVDGLMPATVDWSWGQAQAARAGHRDRRRVRVAVVSEAHAAGYRYHRRAVRLVDGQGSGRTLLLVVVV